MLIVLYLIFISLGIPDSLFGVAWPVIHQDFDVAQTFASYYSMIVGLCTAGISLFAGKLLRKFGTALVTFGSILLTVIGLFGMSIAPNIYVMMLFAVVLGYGAGAIDTGLNNFVSLNYKAQHMNWLHAFWGVGVTLSPLIMSFFLDYDDGSWRGGYRAVAFIQLAILAITAAYLPKWIRNEKSRKIRQNDCSTDNIQVSSVPKKSMLQIFKMKGVVLSIICLGLYSGMEFIIGTWGSSYLISVFEMSPSSASLWVSLYYGGIMLSRILCGFMAMKMSDNGIIRFGINLAALGAFMMIFPFSEIKNLGFLLVGFGFGPIMPTMLHTIPKKFGTEYSADITGYHTFGANGVGFVFQWSFGYIAANTTFHITPFVIFGMAVLFILLHDFILKLLGQETFLQNLRKVLKNR